MRKIMHRQNRLLRLSSLIASLALGLLAFHVPSFGQTSDKQLATALAEIALLKQVIAEQDRRITNLEKALRTLQGNRSATQNLTLATAPVDSILCGHGHTP